MELYLNVKHHYCLEDHEHLEPVFELDSPNLIPSLRGQLSAGRIDPRMYLLCYSSKQALRVTAHSYKMLRSPSLSPQSACTLNETNDTSYVGAGACIADLAPTDNTSQTTLDDTIIIRPRYKTKVETCSLLAVTCYNSTTRFEFLRSARTPDCGIPRQDTPGRSAIHTFGGP